jgi:protein MpaA
MDLYRARLRALPCSGRPARARARARASSPLPATLGHAVSGRPIRAWRVGPAAAARRILVVGCIHGNETAGEAITGELRRARPPRDTALWIVDAFNPDGCAADTRQNARGVDLNRNSPWHWRPLDHPGGTYYSGTGPLSEPESRAIVRFVEAVRPAVSVWYHQHANLVDDSGGAPRIERDYARAVGLPFRRFNRYPGSITSWENATFPDATSFVVELPAGRLPAQSVTRHVNAVLHLAGGP